MVLLLVLAVTLGPPVSSPANLYGTWVGADGEVLQVRGTSAVVVLDDRVVVGRLGAAAEDGNRLTALSATARHVGVERTTSARLRRLDGAVEVCVNGAKRCRVLRPLPGQPIDGPENCLARCLERTQMRAVSPAQLEADCVRSCRDAVP